MTMRLVAVLCICALLDIAAGQTNLSTAGLRLPCMRSQLVVCYCMYMMRYPCEVIAWARIMPRDLIPCRGVHQENVRWGLERDARICL